MFTYWLGRVCVCVCVCHFSVVSMPNALPTLSCLIKYSFFARMWHPEVNWSTVYSCCTWPAFAVNFFFQNFVFKIISTDSLVFSCQHFTICFFFEVPDFSHWYDFSLSTSFSSKLRRNCPCSRLPGHFCVSSVPMSFICVALFLIFPWRF